MILLSQTLLKVFMGVFWIIAYFEILRITEKEKIISIPLFSLCNNLTWELIYSFLFPVTGIFLFINILWLVLDIFIFFTSIKYLLNSKNVNRKIVLFQILLYFIMSHVIILGTHYLFNDVAGALSGMIVNFIMSYLFIYFYFKPDRKLGQSVIISISKMLGTAIASLLLLENYELSFANLYWYILCFGIFFMDNIYCYCLIFDRNYN